MSKGGTHHFDWIRFCVSQTYSRTSCNTSLETCCSSYKQDPYSIYSMLKYTWNPNDLFFEGQPLQNKALSIQNSGHLGSRYIYESNGHFLLKGGATSSSSKFRVVDSTDGFYLSGLSPKRNDPGLLGIQGIGLQKRCPRWRFDITFV